MSKTALQPKPENTAKGKWWDEGVTLVDGCTGKIRCNEHLLKRFENKNGRFFAIWNDLFHSHVPRQFIFDVIKVIRENKQHTFQILTKRIKRASHVFRILKANYAILPNAWLGISASTQKELDEGVPYLRKTPATVRFLSFEPLLGDTWYHFPKEIGWVIIGAESGSNRRECKNEWIANIVRQCKFQGTPVFVKQIHLNGKVCKDIDIIERVIGIKNLNDNRKERLHNDKACNTAGYGWGMR